VENSSAHFANACQSGRPGHFSSTYLAVPGFAGLDAEIAQLHHLAGGGRLVIGLAHIVRPDFQGGGHRAVLDRLELRQIAGRGIFHIVAHALQHFAGDIGGDVLAGPFIDRQLDRIGAFGDAGRLGRRQRAAGHDQRQRRRGRYSRNPVSVH
jgi:hypothetical protein